MCVSPGAPDWAAGAGPGVAEGFRRGCQARPSTPTVDLSWASLLGGWAWAAYLATQQEVVMMVSLNHLRRGPAARPRGRRDPEA